MTLCLAGGTIYGLGRRDLWIHDGVVVAGGAGGERIDVSGCLILPGLVDLHASLSRFEFDGRAAVMGGYTRVVQDARCGPCDSRHRARDFLARSHAAPCRVSLSAALTTNLAGEELADVGRMVESGCQVISNSHHCVASTKVLRDALAYASTFDVPVFLRAGDVELEEIGVVQYGPDAVRLGLRGIPSESEEIGVTRIATMARLTGCRVHITHLWTRRGVNAVRRYRAEGLNITASTTLHQLLVGPGMIEDNDYDGVARFIPPSCCADDRAALFEGLRDGTIDAVATDHRPLAPAKKQLELELATPGAVGLSMAWALLSAHATANELVQWLCVGPSRVLGLPIPTLALGAIADVVVIDPDVDWQVSAQQLPSHANSPFLGRTLRGRPRLTLVGGDIVADIR